MPKSNKFTTKIKVTNLVIFGSGIVFGSIVTDLFGKNGYRISVTIGEIIIIICSIIGLRNRSLWRK